MWNFSLIFFTLNMERINKIFYNFMKEYITNKYLISKEMLEKTKKCLKCKNIWYLTVKEIFTYVLKIL